MLAMALGFITPSTTDLPRLPAPPFQRAVPITPVDRDGCTCRLLPHPLGPSPNSSRVGIHKFPFEACSGFTRVTARWIAQPPDGDLCHEASIRPVAPPHRSSATRSTDNSLDGTSLHCCYAPSGRTAVRKRDFTGISDAHCSKIKNKRATLIKPREIAVAVSGDAEGCMQLRMILPLWISEVP